MDLEVIIPYAVAVIAIGLYVVALWIGDDRTVALLVRTTNIVLVLAVAVIGLSWSLGMSLSLHLILTPSNWIHAIGRMIRDL
jgi:hypothetical protein